jgi:S1-C subfamily serine protease
MNRKYLSIVWLAALMPGLALAQQPNPARAAARAAAVGSPAPAWNRTLQRIASGVVSIRVDLTRSFDTETNESAQATGFVVDAKRGLILTNRHVVAPGPVRAQAIFLDQEEVDLVPIYRDPVHDFGFYKYNPKDLKFIKPVQLPLAPDAAQIGTEIRVVGNDAGERLSILAGTIARLDRQAPNYGRGNYNDFNTFYLQAASGTSGGSSGSPVIDIDGRVIALNAGANTQAESSFFLPLDRVEVALKDIQQGRPVARGTLETEFVEQPYAELRRLGLKSMTEARMRKVFPSKTGLLTVHQVIPDSPASEFLRTGDILIKVNGEDIGDFKTLSKILDRNVGKTVSVFVERGGQPLERRVMVTDLHAITPSEYVEYGGGVFHNLSYEQARTYYRPLKGVYVADPGYVFGGAAVPRGSVILSVDQKAVSDLDDFQRIMEHVPLNDQVSVRFVSFDDPRNEKQRLITNEREWFPADHCVRNDTTGVWPCTPLAAAPPAQPPPTVQDAATYPHERERYVNAIEPSLVLVNFSMPYTVSGVSEHYYYGTGLVVDAKRGWVVVDRNTVPVAMGDVQLTFAGSVEIPGHVEYIHPLHNLAVISYDPKLLGNTPVRAAQFVDRDLHSGDDVSVVGLSPDSKVMSQSTQVASVSQAIFPASRTLRFRDSNLDAVDLVNGPDDFNGAIVDSQGKVLGLWASFAYQTGRQLTQVNKGLPSDLVVGMINHLKAHEPLRSIEVEWQPMPLATARKLDLPEKWVKRYEQHNADRRQLLSVSSTVAGTPAEDFFRSGDILLAIDGKAANTFREVERATQKPRVQVTIFRDGKQVTQAVETVALNGTGIKRVVSWAGALLQAPQRSLAAQRGIDPTGVYVSYFNFGSPASRSGLYAGRRIIAVNGHPTPNLDAFVALIPQLDDGNSVRLNTLNFNNVPQVITLELDNQYWPPYELVREGGDWTRKPLR